MAEEHSIDPAPAVGPAIRPCRHGTMMFLRNDSHIGRSLELYGEYSAAEVDVFGQLVRAGDTVVDAGANIGALTVPLAKMVGQRGRVIAFEPQRPLFQLLCGNLALNEIENVVAMCAAVGESDSIIRVPKLNYRLDDNFGALSITGDLGTPTPLRRIDSLGLEQLRLIKIDVEGAELEAIHGAAETIGRLRPFLYVENDRRAKSPALIAALEAMGYRLWWHPSPLYRPDNFRGNAENVFGHIMSMSMVGVHRDVELAVDGLPAVSGPDDWGYDRFAINELHTLVAILPPP